MAPKTYESMYDKCGRKSLVGLAIQKVNNDSQATVSIHWNQPCLDERTWWSSLCWTVSIVWLFMWTFGCVMDGSMDQGRVSTHRRTSQSNAFWCVWYLFEPLKIMFMTWLTWTMTGSLFGGSSMLFILTLKWKALKQLIHYSWFECVAIWLLPMC